MAGLRAYRLALLVSAVLAAPVRADLKIRVRATVGRGTTSSVHYCREHSWRIDSPRDGYMIVSADKRWVSVDPARRQYISHSPIPPPQASDSAETIVVEIESRDTGEQRQMFGHAARRFITTARRHIEYRDRAPSDITETVTDGWYLDIPGPFPIISRAGSFSVLTASPGQHPKVQVSRKGAAPKGLAVREQTGDNLLEVTEFSEAPLEPGLFEVPAAFRRVVRPLPGEPISWFDQLVLYWQEVEDWLGGL